MRLKRECRDPKQRETARNHDVDDEQGAAVVAHQNDQRHARERDQRDGKLACREDCSLPAITERGPDFGGEIVAEIAKGGEQDIGDDDRDQPGRIGLEEAPALGPGHRRALDAFGLVACVGGRQRTQHPDRNQQ